MDAEEAGPGPGSDAGAPDRLMRKAETVLAFRTDRILLVLERCTDNQNYLACLRTAEILGVQNVWIVLSPRGLKNAPHAAAAAAAAAMDLAPDGDATDAADNEDDAPADAAPPPASRASHELPRGLERAAALPPCSSAADAATTATASPAAPTKPAPKQRAKAKGGHHDQAGEPGGHVDKGELSRKRGRIARSSTQWLHVRVFATTADCVAALAADGREVWATDLAPSASLLEGPGRLALPQRLAVVMGREADGVSAEMLAAAHRRVCLPMYGFSDSHNLSVATAMVLQHLFACCPEARGDLSAERKRALRAEWYGRLARNDAQRAAFMQRLDDPPPPYVDVRRPADEVARTEAAEQAAAAAALGDAAG